MQEISATHETGWNNQSFSTQSSDNETNLTSFSLPELCSETTTNMMANGPDLHSMLQVRGLFTSSNCIVQCNCTERNHQTSVCGLIIMICFFFFFNSVYSLPHYCLFFNVLYIIFIRMSLRNCRDQTVIYRLTSIIHRKSLYSLHKVKTKIFFVISLACKLFC